jgi:hypothetical protein
MYGSASFLRHVNLKGAQMVLDKAQHTTSTTSASSLPVLPEVFLRQRHKKKYREGAQ